MVDKFDSVKFVRHGGQKRDRNILNFVYHGTQKEFGNKCDRKILEFVSNWRQNEFGNKTGNKRDRIYNLFDNWENTKG